ncbi:hypothetical protein HELRODRAFT_70542, partial [Helobdella robusta]|uniref:C2H2-type domain-containing protein n=1 Tax=Helobdella robusta TaxID=6412 RepID=T1G078_HELRO
FQCTLCQKQFGYKNGLIRHVRLTHVGEKPYQCNICNRRFGYKHILMEHQNLHFGNRPYACVQCDKRFAARSNLIQHRTVHKRPYNCSLCNKRFDREDQLKKHLFAHPQMSVIACSSCEYTASNDVLSYYVGQGRLFKCQHCNILFFERGMYFLHSSLHSSPNPWQCSICHKVCSDKNEFTLHFVNQQHNS